MLVALTGGNRESTLARLVTRYGAPRARATTNDAEVLAWAGAVHTSVDAPSALFGCRGAGDWATAVLEPGGVLLESAPLVGRPWFVAERGGLGATHLEALLVALGSSSLELDRTYCAALASGDSPSDATRSPWRGVRTLGPGTRCRLALGEAGPTRASTGPRLVQREAPDAVRELRELLALAVSRSLGARSAVSFSGGLDSTGLLALALHEQPEVLAFALDVDQPGRDGRHRDAASAHLAIEATTIAPEDGAPLALSTMIVDALPTAWPTMPLEIALSRAAARAGADVVLTGNGGDDVFDGDPRLVARSTRHPVRTFRQLLALKGPALPSTLGRMRSWIVAPRARRLAPHALRRLRDRHALQSSIPWLRREATDLLVPREDREAREDADRFQAFAQGHWVTGIAMFRHQIEVASGLVRRDPFLHPELVRFVLSLPPDRLLAGGWMRGLYRQALRGMLPDSVVFRDTKGGFEPGFTRMVRAAGGFAALAPLADVRHLADLRIAEPRRFREAFDALAAAPDDARWIDVWPALSVEAFLRSVDDGSHA